jgi:hypothetical protein
MKKYLKILSVTVAMVALLCFNLSAQDNTLIGNWRLVAQKVTNSDGGVYSADSTSTNMRKMFTPTTVVVVYERVIPELGNQKIVVSCAGGHYTLKGSDYEELLEFASYKDFKSLISKFKLTIEGGKLHTLGTLTGADGKASVYDEWYIKAD